MERAGFTGLSLTEHPVPGARWLDSGGHQSLDPLVALGYIAAATTQSTPAGQRIAIPMGRAGRPADVSGCVVFLASRLSEYVTGTTCTPTAARSPRQAGSTGPGSGWANHVPEAVLAKSGLEQAGREQPGLEQSGP